jgi:tetratricopeptide (TPR) repeat protein
MKKLLFIAGTFVTLSANAQSEKFVKAMEPKVVAIDTTRSVEGLKDLGNAFERIADAEKTQWLPYYYAALAHVNSGTFLMSSGNPMAGGMTAVLDPVADKAEELLNKAEALQKDNSEIWAVRKMITSLRMMGDPMNRWMQYGPKAQEALETARKLNPNNPRVDLLEGQDKFYTPEQYGGSKTEAKKLFEQALKKYDAAKPASSIDPAWGRGVAQYFLGQVK